MDFQSITKDFLSSDPLLSIVIRIGIVVAVLIIGRWLAGSARRNLKTILIKTGLTQSFITLFSTLAYYTILFLVAVLILVLLGVPMTAIATIVAAILIILGIAFQQSLSNIAAAIIFLLFQPFKVGDMIETAGIFGTVKEIQLFNTVIITLENKMAVIPNSNVQNSHIINYSALNILRADMTFSVSYADDLQLVKTILQEAMASDDRILAEPPSSVIIKDFGESSIDFSIRPYVKPDDYLDVQYDMNERVKSRFDEAGITIPFPQRDIHLFESNQAV
jgi:small conductance mechanosensitive channel